MRCLAVLIACLAVGASADVTWHDASKLTIEGRGWAETERAYDRLPAAARELAPPSVWSLSKHSAGLAVRFATDAGELSVRWSLTSDSLAMPHMPATGVSGVDLYRQVKRGVWRFVANGRPSQRDGNLARFTVGQGAMRDYRLYLPLYNGVASLEIGVPDGAQLRPGAAGAPRSRVVYYGTSIAQGGCASRPGTAHVTILGRMLDREMVNLGFSGSGRMEPVMADLLAQIDCSAYVIDCLWNMGGEDADVAARVEALVAAIRKVHRTTPIVFVAQSHMDPGAHPTRLSRVQQQAVKELQDRGFTGLHLIDGSKLIGADGEGTVDGCHPTDLGMMRQAEALAPRLRTILRRAPRNEQGIAPR